MATLFSEIYDLALVELRDYKIDQLYAQSVTDFENYMKGFLLRAIPKFTNSIADLDDTTATQFNDTLTTKEKDILATLLSISWLTREINDVTQFNLHLNDTDFKHFAEGKNLDSKTSHRDKLREIVSQEMVDFGLQNVDWASWANGNFGI